MSIRVASHRLRMLISRAAVLCAISIWITGVVLGVCFGRSLPQAVSQAATAAVCGLFGWILYRIAEPANCLLPFFGMALSASIYERFVKFLPYPVSPLLVLVPVACWAVLLGRALWPVRDTSGLADGLYDTEVDAAG